MSGLFAVLRVEKQKSEGIFARLLHRMKQRKITAETVNTPFGSYVLLTAGSEHVDWDKVAALCGRAGKNLVMSRCLCPPEDSSIGRFEPTALTSKVLRNTCVEIIRRSKLPLYRKIITLVDPMARYVDFVPELLYHCITVKVVTTQVECYNRLSEHLMEELGASIVVTDDMDSFGGSVLVICPDSNPADKIVTTVPVLTAGTIDGGFACKLVGDLQIQPRGELAACTPKGIAPLDFAGALYELNGWQGAEKLTAHTLRCKENLLTPSQIAQYLEQSNFPNHPN
ncbi:hypothetical protein [Hydrogenoanaerobacterium saccharovorans]|uniref:hypothetical protein n=1 Tax=Hydrogenoanaerobacterium saccharovorans TaxID=474960 RepID=UPI000F4D90F9|nr:hypothetical protein [Hydrogenoanaerobacterium saccharovorans]